MENLTGSVPIPGEADETEADEDGGHYYEVGKLLKTDARRDYIDGELELFIPRLGLTTAVFGGTGAEVMEQGVGLFEYSQLPDTLDVNANVSMAGMRDGSMPFNGIDTIAEGDRIYLRYLDILYTYEVDSIAITVESDWRPVQVREYACVTLQAPDPVDSGWDRIFISGPLIDVTEGAPFPTEDASGSADPALPDTEDGVEPSTPESGEPVTNPDTAAAQ